MGKSIRKRPKKKHLDKIPEGHYSRKICRICRKDNVKIGKNNLCEHCLKELS